MKRAQLIALAGVIMLSAFYVTNVYAAETEWIENGIPTVAYCLTPGASPLDLDCDNAGGLTPSTKNYIIQPISYGLTSSDPSVTISKIDLTLTDFYNPGNPDSYQANVYLLNTQDYTNYLANGRIKNSVRATSTGESLTGAGVYTFEFTTPYTVDINNGLYGIMVAIETSPAGSYKVPRFIINQNNYPSYSFPNAIDLGWKFAPDYQDEQDEYDLWFTIYRNDNPLTIDNPTHLEVVTSTPHIIDGDCPATVNLSLSSELSCSYSEYCTFATATCNSNYWYAYLGDLPENGLWYINASSSNWAAYRKFIYQNPNVTAYDEEWSAALASSSQSIIDSLTASTTCPIPFLNWDPCRVIADQAAGTAVGIKSTAEYGTHFLTDIKPFSYAFQIANSIRDAFNSTVSEDVPDLVYQFNAKPYASTTITLFSQSMFTNLFDLENWNRIRPWGEMGIYLMLASYFWFRTQSLL